MNQERYLHLYGNISSQTVAPILEEIIRINLEDADKKPEEREIIRLYVNSGGGVVYDSLALISAMDSSKTPIYTYCYGYAMSAGLSIFIAGHRRFAGLHSTFVIHEAAENLGECKFSVLENRLKETERLNDKVIRYICNRSVLKINDFKNHKYIDWFIDAKGAMNYGIVDEII